MLEPLEALTSYPALVAFCFFCGIAIPLPEDVPQIWAGILIGTGQMDWVPAIAAVAAGVFVRDGLFFGAGRMLGGRALAHPWALRLIGASRLSAAQERVRERGPFAVLLGRFTIGFRTATFFVAGAMGVRPRDFALWDGIALLVSAPALVGLGYLFGEPVIRAVLSIKDQAVWMVPLAGLVVVAGWYFRQRQVSNIG